MTARFRLLASILWTGGLLAACAPAGPFPSLAMRPEERLVSVGEPRRPAVVAPEDPALRQRAAALLAEGRAGQRQFDVDLPAAERATRAPGRTGSESWVSAQQALSRLEASRNQTTTALAALAAFAAERADMPTNPADNAAIAEALAELERVAAAQQSRIDAMRGRISG
jgi:SLT domain-containing protein